MSAPVYVELHDVTRICAEAVHSPTDCHWVTLTFKQNGRINDAPLALTLFTVDGETADRYVAAINSVEREVV